MACQTPAHDGYSDVRPWIGYGDDSEDAVEVMTMKLGLIMNLRVGTDMLG